MVIRDSHLVGLATAPLEAGSIPIVDADTVLAPAIAFESFEPVARQGRKIGKLFRGVDHAELLESLPGATLKAPASARGV
jgi:hypothetical protein